MISYQTRVDNERYIVLGSHLDLNSRRAELHVNSVDVALEDVLQRFQEIDVSGSVEANEERNRQFAVEEFSTSFGFKFRVSWQIAERVDMNRGVGYTLGSVHRNNINGSLLLQSTGVLINNGAGYAAGTTSCTVGATTVVIKSASVHAVVDDEELFVLSTASNPEARSNHLKLGAVHSRYLKNRRG